MHTGVIRKFLIFFMSAAFLISVSGCGSSTLRQSSDGAPDMSSVPSVFVLSSMSDVKGAETIDVTLDESVDMIRIQSLAESANGTTLNFTLMNDDVPDFFNVVTLAGIYGVPSTEEELQRFTEQNPKGYTVEFTDGSGRFYPGLSRFTFLTNTKTCYASVINSDSSTSVYQFKASREMMNMLNKMVADNCRTDGNSGWFNRAFGK